MEEYLAAKAQLFVHARSAAVLHASDSSSALLAEVTPADTLRLGYAARAIDPDCTELPMTLRAESVEVSRDGTRLVLAPSPLADRLGGELRLRVVGAVHAENALAAAVAADAAGYDAKAIVAGLSSFTGVAGRFQIVGRSPLVAVDYAHTPDALERTLSLARSLGDGRVIVVFGCGGDRDRGKRPQMGEVAAREADVVVLTTDNPRHEAPETIADEVAAGIGEGAARILRIPDRAAAIRAAIELAAASDIVVVAGKGHEAVQIVGDREVPFDDAIIARTALTELGKDSP
jgi:UDP-N-acetylmuramoyl-L-alanyl-D-glutamate--2,6-diaminopimelate ligase